ncbi:MAG: hypothetical protein AB7P69_22275 [Candidatus Binatia bacterium]
MSFEFWRIWLLISQGFQVVFGLVIAFCTPRILPWYPEALHLALWETPIVPSEAERLYNWLFGVLGTTMAGAALMQVFVIRFPFKNREPWAWWGLLLALLIWAIPDTIISLYFGIVPNALFNTLPIIAGLCPLLFTYRFFYPLAVSR